MSPPSDPAPAPDARRPPAHHLLVGPARSGTTLACELLDERPGIVALDEPYRRARIEHLSPEGVPSFVAAELDRQHRCIEETGRCQSTLVGDGLGNHYDDGVPAARTRIARFGELTVDRVEGLDLQLVVKHTLLFTAHVDELSARHPMLALVRNPLGVLLSWNSIDAAYRDGMVPGYVRHYVPDLVDRLSAIDDRLDRQVAMLAWHFDRFGPLAEAGRIVRYEDVVATGGRCFDRFFPDRPTPSTSAVTVQDLAGDRRADPTLVGRLVDRLVAAGGPVATFYPADTVVALADRVVGPPGRPRDERTDP